MIFVKHEARMIFINILSLFVLLVCTAGTGAAASRETPVVRAVAHARKAVVNIRTEQIVRRGSGSFGFGDSFFDQFFRELLPPSNMTSQSLGSGVIIDAEGHILTNAHVIAKASRIYVALADGKDELQARLVGFDERLDLAVLQIESAGRWPFLMLGETVIAIGNPLGLGHSITTGVISSVSRRIELEEGFGADFIQSDALINPGNSGGPLININGELIGINTAIARQAQGIGFSIPIDTASRVLDELLRYGQIRPVYLGVLPGNVGDIFVARTGQRGVLVTDFLDESPARDAGMEVADIIQQVAGAQVASIVELNAQLASFAPGSKVEIKVLRGQQQLSLKVKLAPLSDEYLLAYTRRVFGLGFAAGREGLRVVTVERRSAADRAAIEPGDLVVEIARRKVPDMNSLRGVMAALWGREPLSFLVVRNGRGYLLQLPSD
jgi:serine protease Do